MTIEPGKNRPTNAKGKYNAGRKEVKPQKLGHWCSPAAMDIAGGDE
jgi:hypothetical protein